MDSEIAEAWGGAVRCARGEGFAAGHREAAWIGAGAMAAFGFAVLLEGCDLTAGCMAIAGLAEVLLAFRAELWVKECSEAALDFQAQAVAEMEDQ